ncbi:PASTA domain-containing protein [Spirillospora sp. NPDC127200]
MYGPPPGPPPAPSARSGRPRWLLPVGIGCGGLLLLFVVLMVIGAIVGPPPEKTKDKPAAAASTPSSPSTPPAAPPPVTSSPPAAPSSAPVSPSTPATTPAPTKPATPTKARVPRVVGQNHQAAQNAMQAAGFFMLTEKDATGQGRMLLWDRNWVVVRQSPRAGTKVSTDTKITLYSKKIGE